MKLQKKKDIYTPQKTRWNLQDEILPEYPRPVMVRQGWQNLNGVWEYAFSEKKERPNEFQGDIVVPFSPETRLSGVERQLLPGMTLWYERKCRMTQEINCCIQKSGHILLHFGAVDQMCIVYVNHKRAGTHNGGYLPFTLDITEWLKPSVTEFEFTLTLCVEDVTDLSYHSIGKQTLKPGGMYYPGTSGIWQTVWLEAVPAVFISSVIWDSVYHESRICLHATIGGDTTHSLYLKVVFKNREYASNTFPIGNEISVPLPDFIRWSPENPYLYQVRLELYQGMNMKCCKLVDSVDSYFAMRLCSIGTDKKGIQRIFLNNKPYMQVGVLDQGYWPESMYTAPTDEAMIYDIETMKDLGFNMLRKHVKVEPERWYYHCDKLGMLVWQDMVNGGRRNKSLYVTYLATAYQLLGINGSDRHPILLSRQDKAGRIEYVQELTEMVQQMKSHPSVVCIVPFNEGWGQFSTNKMTELVKKLNKSIIVDQASGWYDMKGGDLKSIHNYFLKLKVRRERYRAFALTEFGGYAWKVEGHCSYEREYGYKIFFSKEDLTEGYEKLMRDAVVPAVEEGLSATVYTQLSDVEEEINGILTYDREVIKIDEEVIRKYNRECKALVDKNW